MAGKFQFAAGYLVGGFLKPALRILREKSRSSSSSITEDEKAILAMAAELLPQASPWRRRNQVWMSPGRWWFSLMVATKALLQE